MTTLRQVFCSAIFFSIFNRLHNAVVGDRMRHNQKELAILNDSGERLQIEWINPSSGDAVSFGEIGWNGNRAAEPFHISSYVNHTFVIKSTTTRNRTDTEAASPPPSATLVVGELPTQNYIVQRNVQLQPVANLDDHRRRLHIGEATRSSVEAKDIVNKCRELYDDGSKTVGYLVECLKEETARALVEKQDELAFEKQLRVKVANMIENYTCADPTISTTKPNERRTWTYENVTRSVGVLHERPASQIHIIENFIDADECEAIRVAAEPKLHRGTVADGKGGSRMSENRKAWQAGLTITDWRDPSNPIAAVKRRLFAYANFVTGYNMSLDGQEELMSIQYFGDDAKSNPPDRYTPHCDGDCDGRPHKTGGRVATMVMYCNVPTLGGATNFQHANVYVKPTLGAGVFFSYMDRKTSVHEEGFTTHSGCPVLEGTKRIAVQWMRVGVDLDNPWDSFDTNTIKLSSKIDSD